MVLEYLDCALGAIAAVNTCRGKLKIYIVSVHVVLEEL